MQYIRPSRLLLSSVLLLAFWGSEPTVAQQPDTPRADRVRSPAQRVGQQPNYLPGQRQPPRRARRTPRTADGTPEPTEANLFMRAGADFSSGFIFSPSLSTGDVNGDAHPDLLIHDQLYLGTGDGRFSRLDTDLISFREGTSTMADVNQDGHADLLFSTPTGFALYLETGNGSFKRENTTLIGLEYGSISVADVNGDQNPDVLLTGYDHDHDGTTRSCTWETGRGPSRRPTPI